MTTKQYYQEIFKRKAKAFLWMILKLIPDEFFIKAKYFFKFGKWLDLNTPKTFNEKLQYLKLKQTDQIYCDLADKFKVREYIKEKLWEEVLTKLYWHGKTPEEIPFDELPSMFVIKCNHGSGYNIIVPDKSKLDIKQTINILKLWMKEDYWIIKRELQYKNINKMIIVEEFLEDKEFSLPPDYKFWCFNWEVKFMNIHFQEDWITKINIYDTNLEIQNHWMVYPNNLSKNLKLPLSIDKMKEYSKILSKWFPFLRCDFYEVNWKIYFWEVTMYPTNWEIKFYPNHEELDKKYWEMILL